MHCGICEMARFQSHLGYQTTRFIVCMVESMPAMRGNWSLAKGNRKCRLVICIRGNLAPPRRWVILGQRDPNIVNKFDQNPHPPLPLSSPPNNPHPLIHKRWITRSWHVTRDNVHVSICFVTEFAWVHYFMILRKKCISALVSVAIAGYHDQTLYGWHFQGDEYKN